MTFGLLNNAGDSPTELESTASNWTFDAFNLEPVQSPQHADGIGGLSEYGVGVEGIHGALAPPNTNLQPGVLGRSAVTPGVFGLTDSSTGVIGQSLNGRGGVFIGNPAQIQLWPGTRGSHPNAGAPGDLYVDSQLRLWFCKGGTSWTQLA